MRPTGQLIAPARAVDRASGGEYSLIENDSRTRELTFSERKRREMSDEAASNGKSRVGIFRRTNSDLLASWCSREGRGGRRACNWRKCRRATMRTIIGR